MKKSLFFVGVLSVVILSCTPKDTKLPVIYLEGDTETSIILGTAFVEPQEESEVGYTAHDNVDGDVTSAVNKSSDLETSDGTIYGNTTRTGTYTITYSVTDKEGNIGTAARTVSVFNTDQEFCVTYYVDKESLVNNAMWPDYLQKEVDLVADKKVNDRIIFKKLSGEVSGVYGDLKRYDVPVYEINGPDTITTYVTDSISILIEPQEIKDEDGFIYRVKGVDDHCYFINFVDDFKFTIKYQIDRHEINSDGTAGGRVGSDDVIEIYTKK